MSLEANPYQTPSATESVPPGELSAKAAQVLARRDAPHTWWYYVARTPRRQVSFVIALIFMPAGLLLLDLPVAALAAGCFFVGLKCRDIQWWVTLAREWPTTSALIDWSKVERLANEADET